jgi:hypothetical protein
MVVRDKLFIGIDFKPVTQFKLAEGRGKLGELRPAFRRFETAAQDVASVIARKLNALAGKPHAKGVERIFRRETRAAKQRDEVRAPECAVDLAVDADIIAIAAHRSIVPRRRIFFCSSNTP